jgi:uncharacterized protein YjbI with pentapeptide repeats
VTGKTNATSAPIPPKSTASPEQAKDLKALRDAMNDAAATTAGLWFSYLFVLLYLLIAVSSVTHRNILFEEPVKLPFLGVDLPLIGFFVIGPALFLIVHAYVLLHCVLFAGKVGVFQREFQNQITDDEVRTQLRWQLPNNIFVQLLAGNREIHGRPVELILTLVAQISLLIGPLALLVLFQLQLLPYHPPTSIALWLRIAVLLDVILLWTLWPSVTRGKLTRIGMHDFRCIYLVPFALAKLLKSIAVARSSSNGRSARKAWHVLHRVSRGGSIVVAAVLSLLLILVVFTISTFVGEWLEGTRKLIPVLETVHKLMFAGEPNEITGRPGGFFSNRLVITDQSFVDVDKLDRIDVSHSFRGRDLGQAVLNRADLRKADFTGAILNGASFQGAKLQNARFNCVDVVKKIGCTQLQGADFTNAHLQNANLEGANLESADLFGADFHDAILGFANLQDTDLYGAELQGARLYAARLDGAELNYAHMEGADLSGATLQASIFGGAGLQGADLSRANMQGALFGSAKLQGASLEDALAQGADFTGSQFKGASLARGRVWRTLGIKLDLADVHDCDPNTPPWYGAEASAFATWRDKVVAQIPQIRRDAEMARAHEQGVLWNFSKSTPRFLLGKLGPGWEKETEYVKAAEFWRNACSTRPSDDNFETKLAISLTELACLEDAAPYIARGLLRNGRIEAAGAKAMDLLDTLLKGKSDPSVCPGVVGFVDADWALVRKVRRSLSNSSTGSH